MLLKLAICDDDENALTILNDCLMQYQMDRNIDFDVDVYSDGESLLKEYNQKSGYHAVFLDIEMPDINGIDLATIIRKNIDRHAVIIFVSSYPKYMQESFSVHPYHFITKPYETMELFKVLDDMITDVKESNIIYTIVDCDDYEITVNIKDILYFESVSSKKQQMIIHTIDKNINAKGTISSWEKKLNAQDFILCYRGFLVNLLHIHYIKNGKIILTNGDAIPIKRELKGKISDIFMERFFLSKI